MSWATAKVENPSDVKLTVCLTLAMDDWKKLSDMLANIPMEHRKYPLYQIQDAIRKATAKVCDRVTERIDLTEGK